MKVEIHLVCVFALFAVVFSQSPEKVKKITEECQKKIQATKDELNVLYDYSAVPKTQNEFCLVACFYKEIGAMNDKNELVYEKAVWELEPYKKEDKDKYNEYAKITKECTDEVKPNKNECETIKIYTECITKKTDLDA